MWVLVRRVASPCLVAMKRGPRGPSTAESPKADRVISSQSADTATVCQPIAQQRAHSPARAG